MSLSCLLKPLMVVTSVSNVVFCVKNYLSFCCVSLI